MSGGRVEMMTLQDVVNRIYAHTRPDGGCLVATRGRAANGYARQWFDGRNHWAHRLVAKHYYGPCPDGMVTMHLCHRGKDGCVTASHLRYGTQKENVAADMVVGSFSGFRNKYYARRLTHEQVASVWKMRAAGMSFRKIAEHVGVGDCAIRNILSGKTYRNWQGATRLGGHDD